MKVPYSILCLVLFTSCSVKLYNSHNKKISPDDVMKFYKNEVKYLNIHPSDTLVDIGSGDGSVNAFYSVVVDNLHQFLVDKNKRLLKSNKVKTHFKSFQRLYKSSNRYSYDLVINKSNSIPLPSSAYPKVLCRRSFHEFSEPVPMVQEIHRILKDSGTVIVMEAIATESLLVDPFCKLPYVTPEYVIKTFRENGFTLQSQSEETMPFDDNRKMSVLIFKKA